MKEPGISRQFILVCIAVLLASYGVGLGVKKIRFAGADTEVTVSPETDKEKAVAEKVASDEPGDKKPEEQEEVAATPEPDEGRRMMGPGMSERLQNMSEEERQEFMARMRERGGRSRGGGGAFSQLSEEDRENLRAEMEELGTRAGELSEEEMRQARNEILEKYGITPGFRRSDGGGGGGGRRRGREGGGGEAPVKGRACFIPQTPVWVDGKLVQIAKVSAGRTIGINSCGALSVAQIQEHEGTFECRDIVLESGNTIGVVCSHCFMLESGKWIAAQNLTAGLRLKTLNGAVAIKKVTKRTVPYTGKVYNLKVKNSDRYFVGKDVVIVRDY